MTTTNPLSPTAQAVLDAYIQGLATKRRNAIAAALRAAADQVVPHDSFAAPSWTDRDEIRAELLAIATELEAHR